MCLYKEEGKAVKTAVKKNVRAEKKIKSKQVKVKSKAATGAASKKKGYA